MESEKIIEAFGQQFHLHHIENGYAVVAHKQRSLGGNLIVCAIKMDFPDDQIIDMANGCKEKMEQCLTDPDYDKHCLGHD